MNTFRDEEKASVSAKVIEEVDKWMERFDCVVIGPGLGRDQFLLVRIFHSVFSSFNLNACTNSISSLVKISGGQLILSLDVYPISGSRELVICQSYINMDCFLVGF